MSIIIHYTGAGYYYATTTGVQLSKHYKTLNALRRYGRIYPSFQH